MNTDEEMIGKDKPDRIHSFLIIRGVLVTLVLHILFFVLSVSICVYPW